MHLSPFCHEVRRETLMVFHITGTQMIFVFTGKLIKQIRRFFTEQVNQNVQTTTVCHAQHHFAGVLFTGMTNQVFQHRNEGIAPFQ